MEEEMTEKTKYFEEDYVLKNNYKSKEFQVREDLNEYFEVLDHSETTLVCKLAGQSYSCKYDGKKDALKYSSKRGWYNFERHLAWVHDIQVKPSIVNSRKQKNKISSLRQRKVKARDGFTIREDLQPYFEVIDEKELTLKCKLAEKTHKCRFDGEKEILKYTSHRGWFNFERHLVKTHNITLPGKFENDEEVDNLPRKPVTVRESLEPYFEICKGSNSKFVCKLAGQNPNCKYDGIQRTLKYYSCRGWFNFERHLSQIHKMDKANFSEMEMNPKKKIIKKRTSETITGSTTSVDFPTRAKLSTEKHCLVCRERCAEKYQRMKAGELADLFPGAEGCATLNKQLIILFFLRSVLEFPSERCTEFLKRCRGLRSPETWFFLCSHCNIILVKTAKLHDQILSLQEKLQNLKNLVKAKVHDSIYTNTDLSLSEIEREIRQFVQDNSSKPTLKHETAFDDLDLDDDVGMDCSFGVQTDINESDMPSIVQCESIRSENFMQTKLEFDYLAELGSSETTEDANCSNNVRNELVLPKTSNEISGRRQRRRPRSNLPDNLDIVSDYSDAEMDQDDSDDSYDAALSDSSLFSDDSDFIPKRASVTGKRKVSKNLSTPKNDVARKTVKKKSSNAPLVQKQKTHSKAATNSTNENIEVTIYSCDKCPSMFKTLKGFKQHEEAHEVSKALDNEFDCPHCGYPCSTSRARAIHITHRHDPREYACSLCDYLAPRRKLLTKHLQQHRESSQRERVGDKFPCKICNKLFPTYILLCRHKRSIHSKEMGVMPFRCEFCSDILSSNRHLRDHIQQTHKKESKYYCEVCGKGTMYMSKLKRHMKSHFKEKAYVCEICGAGFVYDETLRNHMKKEHPENNDFSLKGGVNEINHVCKHCDMKLPSATALARHIRSHAELFHHKCDLCGNGYATLQSLRRHKEINHSEEQVPCQYCGKLFLHKEYVRTHYKFCKRIPEKNQSPGGSPSCVLSDSISVDPTLKTETQDTNNTAVLTAGSNVEHIISLSTEVLRSAICVEDNS